MEGKILGVDEGSKQGAIRAQDGSRYYFQQSEWRGDYPPQQGMIVDYDVTAEKLATNVYPLTKPKVVIAGSYKADKSKTTATLLALFLGGLGGHKFYVGSYGWGVLYLLFCWTYIPFILAVIETVNLVAMSEESFQSKYHALDDEPFSFLW